jgi:hypothetical protein
MREQLQVGEHKRKKQKWCPFGRVGSRIRKRKQKGQAQMITAKTGAILQE